MNKILCKEMRKHSHIICAADNELCLLLAHERATHYLVRRINGQKCVQLVYDYGKYAICAGRAPYGDITPPPKLVVKYELAADKIRRYYSFDVNMCARRMHELVREFICEAIQEADENA